MCPKHRLKNVQPKWHFDFSHRNLCLKQFLVVVHVFWQIVWANACFAPGNRSYLSILKQILVNCRNRNSSIGNWMQLIEHIWILFKIWTYSNCLFYQLHLLRLFELLSIWLLQLSFLCSISSWHLFVSRSNRLFPVYVAPAFYYHPCTLQRHFANLHTFAF